MRNKMARDFCVECINQVLSDGTNSYIENPAIKFTEMAKNGDFDPLSEEEYTALLGEVKMLAKLFNNLPRRAAGSILLDVLANAPRVSYKLKDDLAYLLGRLLTGPGDEEIPPLSPETIQAMEDYVCEQTEEMLDDLVKDSTISARRCCGNPSGRPRPRKSGTASQRRSSASPRPSRPQP